MKHLPARATAEIDHLVVAGHTLDECVQWCEATLNVAPGPGGAHPLMGTHNRLLNISSAAFPRCYLEIIAIDRSKRSTRAKGFKRWFDLDDNALQATLASRGPRLMHFAARVPDAQASVDTLAAAPVHIDRGEVIEASRDTPAGRLEWRITVRDDGQRLFYGALPTLIQWGAVHPTDSMAPCGIELVSLAATHARADSLQVALGAIGLNNVDVRRGAPNLVATLQTPQGLVTLESKGL